MSTPRTRAAMSENVSQKTPPPPHKGSFTMTKVLRKARDVLQGHYDSSETQEVELEMGSVEVEGEVEEVEVSLEVPATSFVLFPKLPMELQSRIWWLVCQEARIIDVGARTFKDERHFWHRISLADFCLGGDPDPKSLASPTFPPPVLHVSKAARECAQLSGCYELVTVDDDPKRWHKEATKIWINPGRDIVYLDESAQKLIDPCPRSSSSTPYPGPPARFNGLLKIETIMGPRGWAAGMTSYRWLHHLRDFGALRKIIDPEYGPAGEFPNDFERTPAQMIEQKPDLKISYYVENLSFKRFFRGNCVRLEKYGYFRLLPNHRFERQVCWSVQGAYQPTYRNLGHINCDGHVDDRGCADVYYLDRNIWYQRVYPTRPAAGDTLGQLLLASRSSTV